MIVLCPSCRAVVVVEAAPADGRVPAHRRAPQGARIVYVGAGVVGAAACAGTGTPAIARSGGASAGASL